jgi:hypothetical protein
MLGPKKNPLSGDLITAFYDSYVNESSPLPSLQPVAAYNNAYYAYNVNNNAGNGLKFHQKSTCFNSLFFSLADRRPLVKPFCAPFVQGGNTQADRQVQRPCHLATYVIADRNGTCPTPFLPRPLAHGEVREKEEIGQENGCKEPHDDNPFPKGMFLNKTMNLFVDRLSPFPLSSVKKRGVQRISIAGINGFTAILAASALLKGLREAHGFCVGCHGVSFLQRYGYYIRSR